MTRLELYPGLEYGYCVCGLDFDKKDILLASR